MALSEENRQKGVFVGSNGNYALAMACHAKQLGVPLTVVVPRFIPLSVISLCKDFGAKVVVEGKNHVESKRLAFKLAKENGGTFIDGHDHIDIIAGAGSIAIEIVEQVKDVDTVVVPVGGGALLAGICIAFKELSPQTKVVAVEPKAAPCFSSAMKSGQPVRIKAEHSLASSLVVSRAGYNSFNIVKDKIDKIVDVKEESLALGVLRLLEQEKTVVEGAAALGPAALLEGSIQGSPGKNVVCILTGGNIDSTVVGRSVEKGLLADDRLVMFEVFIPDRPGSICEIFEITSHTGGSVKDISMEHVFHQFGMFTLKMKIVVETRGLEHSKELKDVLCKRYGDDLRFYMRQMSETRCDGK
ncbi:pyridoxal-phosphate dependent protein [Oesophagostomum dentatum]|uniref:L-serine deaminase n=1 Tax=Oesophagostomum dentatum TaxID=61180 RepID=A0A0B1S5Z9_OESDE|nr:pyridoxal-phosphate dependent protein [Oesophagostomum dentatum]